MSFLKEFTICPLHALEDERRMLAVLVQGLWTYQKLPGIILSPTNDTSIIRWEGQYKMVQVSSCLLLIQLGQLLLPGFTERDFLDL